MKFNKKIAAFLKIALTLALTYQFDTLSAMKRKDIGTFDNSAKKQKTCLDCPRKGNQKEQIHLDSKNRCVNNNRMDFTSQATLNAHIISYHRACPWCHFTPNPSHDALALAKHTYESHLEESLACQFCKDFIVLKSGIAHYSKHVNKCKILHRNQLNQTLILPNGQESNQAAQSNGLQNTQIIGSAEVHQQFFNTHNNIETEEQFNPEIFLEIITKSLENELHEYNNSNDFYLENLKLNSNTLSPENHSVNNEQILPTRNCLPQKQKTQIASSCPICCIFHTNNQNDLENHMLGCSESNLIFEVINLDDEDLSEDSENENKLDELFVNKDESLDFINQINDIDYPLNPLFDESINQDFFDNLPTSNFLHNNNTSSARHSKQKNTHKTQKSKSVNPKKTNAAGEKKLKKPQKLNCFLVDRDHCTNNNERGYCRPNFLYDHILKDHITCPWPEQCGLTEQFKSKKELHEHINAYQHAFSKQAGRKNSTWKSNYCEKCDYLSIDTNGNFRRHKESNACKGV